MGDPEHRQGVRCRLLCSSCSEADALLLLSLGFSYLLPSSVRAVTPAKTLCARIFLRLYQRHLSSPQRMHRHPRLRPRPHIHYKARLLTMARSVSSTRQTMARASTFTCSISRMPSMLRTTGKIRKSRWARRRRIRPPPLAPRAARQTGPLALPAKHNRPSRSSLRLLALMRRRVSFSEAIVIAKSPAAAGKCAHYADPGPYTVSRGTFKRDETAVQA